MARTALRLRLDDTGRLEVVDPGFDTLPLLCAIDPGFRVQQAPLPGFTAPRVLTLPAIPGAMASREGEPKICEILEPIRLSGSSQNLFLMKKVAENLRNAHEEQKFISLIIQ
jgi:hypothetical protein